MIQEENVKKQGDEGFAFDRSETLTPNQHANPSRVKKIGVESWSDCGAEASFYGGRSGANRGQIATGSKLARPSVAQLWAGYDVSGQRFVEDASMAGVLRAGGCAHHDCPPTAKDAAHRQSGTDTGNARLPETLADDQPEATKGLCVHSEQAERQRSDYAGALCRSDQNLGRMVGARARRIFQPLNPAQQTGAHVLGRRRHCADFALAGTPVDSQHRRIFGHYPTQGRGSRVAPQLTARKWRAVVAQLQRLLPLYGRKSIDGGVISVVKINSRQDFFCQQSLTRNSISVENKVTSKLLQMAKFGTLAAGAFALSTALGAAEQADAQATGLTLPHPDGEISIDVSRVAYETQADILAQLQGCLEAGYAFADADENKAIEGDEQFDWDDERAFCAETAERDFSIADSQAGIADSQAGIAESRAAIRAAEARSAEAQARIAAMTEELIQGAREENDL